jgi:hypothetical protein
MTVVELSKHVPRLETLLQATRRGEIVFMKRGRPIAILGKLSREDWEDWQYEHSQAAIRLGRRARAQIRRGQCKTFDEIKKLHPAEAPRK